MPGPLNTPRDLRGVVACVALLCTMFGAPTWAQWIHYPTAGIPRTQDGKPDLKAPAPRSTDGNVDISGIWLRQRGINTPASNPQGLPGRLTYFMPADAVIPLRPEAAALYKQRSDNLGAGRPSERCLPHGIPDAMLYGGPMKIVTTPRLTLILYEDSIRYRQIFTDGRPFPNDPQPTWFGYSVGKWEGDAFVVDSVGFNDQTWMDDSGLPHTDALHTTERFRRIDVGHLVMDLTINDPKAYTRPWSVSIGFDLLADTELIEFICENERSAQHILIGK